VSGHRAESLTVNVAGLVQGIALVTFPAASGIFTSPAGYNLTSSQYGLLLAATACLGAGFGAAVPSLNTLTAALHPDAEDRSVLVLNALLGLGTALAPAFVAVFNGIGFWIGLPILAAVLLAGLIVVSLRLPLRPAATPGKGQRREQARTGLPLMFWVFGVFAFLYGICETMNGNWSQLDLASLGVKSATASLALTGFWAMVTAGRVLIAGPAQRNQVAGDHEPDPARQERAVDDGPGPADVPPVLDPQRDGPRDYRQQQELEPVP
jgi:fucose permease